MLNAATANAGAIKRWNMGANLPRDTRDTLFLLGVIGWFTGRARARPFSTWAPTQRAPQLTEKSPQCRIWSSESMAVAARHR